MYIKTTNGAYEKQYSIGQLRKDNPQTSFPKNPTDALLAEWNVFPVVPTSRPDTDDTKDVVEGTPINQDGKWVQVWNVTDVPPEELAAREYRKADNIRSERNQKLTESDWTQVADAPVNQALWAEYRQALRNIPEQAGFPDSVVWPAMHGILS